jgi:RNA polymerase sigma-70 factor, ECF subfamily
VRFEKGKNDLSLSEAELIERAKSGDREAFGLLARNFERRLYALALYYARDAHDAEDLSQEVWLKAYRAMNSFRGESSFYTWLRRIAINTFLNHQRDEKVIGNQGTVQATGETMTLDETKEVADERSLNLEEALQQRQLVAQVTEALTELTPQQRLIFLLKHREGMSSEEIAQACRVSVGTVKKSLFRSLHKIRERLGVARDTKESSPMAMSETV